MNGQNCVFFYKKTVGNQKATGISTTGFICKGEFKWLAMREGAPDDFGYGLTY